MPNRCIMLGCSNEPNVYDGIALHSIPYSNDQRPEAMRRRKLWIDFVRETRVDWTPSHSSVVCSKHFVPEDFMRRFAGVYDKEKPLMPRLRRDSIGVCVWPSVLFPENTRGMSVSWKEFDSKYDQASTATVVNTKMMDGSLAQIVVFTKSFPFMPQPTTQETRVMQIVSSKEELEMPMKVTTNVSTKDAGTQTLPITCHNCTKL